MLFHAYRLHARAARLRLMTVRALHDDRPIRRLDALRGEMHVVREVQSLSVLRRSSIREVRVIQQEVSGP
jgi:hypothetical protein